MLFGQDRNQMRKFYRDAWRKHQEKAPMEALEAMVADVVLMHPEYHPLLENELDDLDQEGNDVFGRRQTANGLCSFDFFLSLFLQLSS